MKAVLASIVIAGSLLAIGPTEALAWYCRADSNTGAWGWATRYWRGAAVSAALWQCSVRTPRWGRCYISFCR
jgi:peptidoglycan/LPS O-acetylase OafA/YrhL